MPERNPKPISFGRLADRSFIWGKKLKILTVNGLPDLFPLTFAFSSNLSC